MEPVATGPTEPSETAREDLTGSGSGSSGDRVGLKVATWIALPLGLAGIGVGIYYSYEVSHANNLLDPSRRFPCTNSPQVLCDGSGTPKPAITDPTTLKWIQDTKSLGDKYQRYQWYFYVPGAALVAASVTFFYLGYLSRPSGATADARGSSLQFAPMFSSNGVGAMAFAIF